MEDALAETDVLYVTRVQKERFASEEEYESVRGSYVITPELMKAAKQEYDRHAPTPKGG